MEPRCCAACLLWIDKRCKLRPGRLLGVYVLGYGIGRFWVEGLRIDPAHEIGGLRLEPVGGAAVRSPAAPRPSALGGPAAAGRRDAEPESASNWDNGRGRRNASPASRKPTDPLPSGGVSERITPDDVAHVAAGPARPDRRRAGRFTDQLADVLEHFADIDALALDDVAPMAQPYPLVNVLRDDVVAPEPRPRRGAGRGAGGRGRPLPGAADPGRGAVTRRCRDRRRRPRPASARPGDVRRGAPRPHRRPRGEIHAFNLVLADEAARRRRRDRRRGRGRRRPRPAGRRAGRAQGQPLHARASRPRARRGSSRAGGRRTTPPSSSGCAPPAPCSSARPTSTSSPWARPPRTRRSARPATRTTPTRVPGGSSGRQRGRGGGRVRAARARLATPAARSASPPRCAASSA